MIEVKLLDYAFQFRRLSWREEFRMKFGGEDPRRIVLATALDNVSGLKIETLEDAMKVLKSIPEAVLQRAYIIYRYKLPKTRIFSTQNLYKAPEPAEHFGKIQKIEEEKEEAMDVLHRQMEATFGRQELQEQRELEGEILARSGHRGAIKKDPEEETSRYGGFKKTQDKPLNVITGEQQTHGPTHRQRGIRPKAKKPHA
jgi:hypothetical protein